MNSKDLRKLNRKELLELLLSQATKIEELEEELAEARSKIDSKTSIIKESGSLIEASLKLSGIFENAQKISDEYLEDVKKNCALLERKTKRECAAYKKKTIEEVESKCRKREEKADEYVRLVEEKLKPRRKQNILGKIKAKEVNCRIVVTDEDKCDDSKEILRSLRRKKSCKS